MSQRHDFRSAARQTPPTTDIDPRQKFFGEYQRTEQPSPEAYLTSDNFGDDELEIPDDAYANQTLLEWAVHETETITPSRKLIFWLGLILMAIIGYALFVSNSPIVAITFILAGLMGYLLLHKEPRFLRCRIVTQGVAVNRELFPFETTDSFWIFDEHEPAFVRLKTRTFIEPNVDIPLGDTDPETARKILLTFLPEERSELTLVDILARMLHI